MPLTVLIVDDSLLNRELAQAVLESRGFDVLTASDAAECFAVLAGQRPDLILMDIQLPDKDGLQITRELRADAALRDLLIVAMTAHAMAEDQQRALEAGCDAYLTKPIQTRTLASYLEGLITARQTSGGTRQPADSTASGAM